MDDVEKQIDAAYDYRGHVTVTLKNGTSVEGFLFNRQKASPKLKEPPFIELYLKGTSEHRKITFADVAAVALTGEDTAAGKSFEDYQKKKAAEKKA
jgi:hypothetical protein